MKRCPNCNASNPDTARTCQECSMPLGTVSSTKLSPAATQSTQREQPQYARIRDNMRQNASNNVYFGEVKKYLSEKDGKVHVLMINSFSKWINQVFGIDEKYTIQIDSILSNMQYDGYEIIDVKFSTEQNQGLFNEMEGFYTMILYR